MPWNGGVNIADKSRVVILRRPVVVGHVTLACTNEGQVWGSGGADGGLEFYPHSAAVFGNIGGAGGLGGDENGRATASVRVAFRHFEILARRVDHCPPNEAATLGLHFRLRFD